MKYLEKGLKYMYKKTDVIDPEQFAKQQGRPRLNKLTFEFQDGPVGEVGENGIQVGDLLYFIYGTISSLNGDFPCKENLMTLQALDNAIFWQNERTKDRIIRGVEGRDED